MMDKLFEEIRDINSTVYEVKYTFLLSEVRYLKTWHDKNKKCNHYVVALNDSPSGCSEEFGPEVIRVSEGDYKDIKEWLLKKAESS